jgi:tellurite methyltransferase
MDRNQVYLNNPHPWGHEHLQFLPDFCHMMPENSKVLDLGSGDGRNAKYIAKSGNLVQAVDFSESALAILVSDAYIANLPIEVQLADLNNYELTDDYGGVCCNFALHFLQKQQALRLLTMAKARTIKNGVHFICDFLPHRIENIGRISADEIIQVYTDWEISLFNIVDEKMSFAQSTEESRFEAFYLIAAKRSN